MINRDLYTITSRLDHAFSIADSINEDELKSHIARYLCVLTSGYIEESIKIIFEYYTSQNASPNIINYISQSNKKLTNLNSEKIEKYLSYFNTQFRDEFTVKLSTEKKDAIDSVIANRHIIVHGGNVGVTYIRIRNWYTIIKTVIQDIRLILSV